jgi:hypothetical protein
VDAAVVFVASAVPNVAAIEPRAISAEGEHDAAETVWAVDGGDCEAGVAHKSITAPGNKRIFFWEFICLFSIRRSV